MDVFTFKCSCCHRSFEPDPAMVLPITWSRAPDDEDDEDCLTEEELEMATAEDLAGLAMTLADRDALLAGVEVQAGARLVCMGCQMTM